MQRIKNTLLAMCAGAAIAVGATAATAQPNPVQHVLLISVDGLHAVDLQNWLISHPAGAFARLAAHGAIFPNAYTTAPSDSFPGMVAQVSGATPKTAGVFYDDSYERTYFPPNSGCVGLPGAETTFAENIDNDSSRLDAGGQLGQPLTQISWQKLPMVINKAGKCEPVLPHQFIKVNTVFEIIKAAGLRTAWCDKHPAYEILNGPSGHGIDDLYTPEINSQLIGGAPGNDNTTSYWGTRKNDEYKVVAVLNEIDGKTSTGRAAAPVPAIFGMNFQAVSVGQKLAHGGFGDRPGSLKGGYLDGNATPGDALTQQLTFVDDSIGRMLSELDGQGLTSSTLVIVSAKHGQSPIDRTLRVALDDSGYDGFPSAGFHIADDVSLIWLQPQTRDADLAGARAYLLANADRLGIELLLDHASLKDIYADPETSTRTPDFVAVSKHGVIYTGGSKLSEHGGFSNDDRNVALVVSGANVSPSINYSFVQTTQIAPTILSALGLDPAKLDGVRLEGTRPLPF